jgi:Na+/H+ antiporter NhaD/arsenite permease-like protein
VFFIFVVCNTGGCLLPIGDPPLFLGYLRGVDFLWTLNLWPMWLTMNVSLVVIYFFYDVGKYRKESKPLDHLSQDNPDPLTIEGSLNFAWLLGVIFCVALIDPSRALPGTDWKPPVFLRETLMLILTALSLQLTAFKVRQKNLFNFAAIIEVAVLFIGIFICMQAPIQILNEYGPDLGFNVAWKFFWGTGALSSFLDNAPTYVVFFETAKTVAVPDSVLVAGVTQIHLVAISLGSVFMGSMTYIGNGPNFMVKAIAEKNNIRMPSFFGYIVFSVMFVLPVCMLISLIFLRE